MPRTPRLKSASDIYHVMIRGINQVQLFYDDEDKSAFLDRLERYKKECEFSLYAWCLMGNHAHLLVKTDLDTLSVAMKKLQLSYSSYYDRKYDRTGYLFQDRFKSKPVDGDAYFLATLRYIHRNPLEAGGEVSEWTSYDEYTKSPSLTDTEFALSMLADEKGSAAGAFRELIDESKDSGYICAFDDSHRPTDAEAKEIICQVAAIDHCQQLCEIERENQRNIIGKLRTRGLSVRQIARLTGLNRNTVERARSQN